MSTWLLAAHLPLEKPWPQFLFWRRCETAFKATAFTLASFRNTDRLARQNSPPGRGSRAVQQSFEECGASGFSGGVIAKLMCQRRALQAGWSTDVSLWLGAGIGFGYGSSFAACFGFGVSFGVDFGVSVGFGFGFGLSTSVLQCLFLPPCCNPPCSHNALGKIRKLI